MKVDTSDCVRYKDLEVGEAFVWKAAFEADLWCRVLAKSLIPKHYDQDNYVYRIKEDKS